VKVTEPAQAKVVSLIKDSQIATPDHIQFLRIAVQPGGCSGLKYQLYFDYEVKDGDVRTTYDGFDIMIDKMSVPYFDGATIGYEESIQKIGFTIDNPASKGSCACGDSFN